MYKICFLSQIFSGIGSFYLVGTVDYSSKTKCSGEISFSFA